MITITAKADFGMSGQYVARINGRDSKYTFNREFLGRKSGKRNETTEADTDEEGLYERCDVTKRGKDSSFLIILTINGDLYAFKSDKEDAMKIAKEMDSGRKLAEIVSGKLSDEEAKILAEKLKKLRGVIPFSPNEYDLDRLIPADLLPVEVSNPDKLPLRTRDVLETLKEVEKATSERLAVLASEGKYPTRSYVIVSAKEAEKKQSAQTLDSAIESCWQILQMLPEKDAKKVMSALKLKISPKTENATE